MPVREDFATDQSEQIVMAYHARITMYVEDVTKTVAEYLRLRSEEQQLRRMLKLPGLDEEEAAQLQAGQEDLALQMRQLATRFFNWGFAADDLRNIPKLDEHQMKNLALEKLAVAGFSGPPEVPPIEENRMLFQRALDKYRTGVIHSEVLAGRRLVVEDNLPLPPQPVKEEAPPPPPALDINPEVKARMAVEQVVAGVLRSLQQDSFPGGIAELWRIWSVIHGRPVVRVELVFTPEGDPVAFRCFYRHNNGPEQIATTANTDAAVLEDTLNKLIASAAL